MDGTMDVNMPVTGPNEEALAVQVFENFCAASTMSKILALFREMCRILKLKPTVMPDFYTKLRQKLSKSWRAQAIFKKLDVRSNFKVYNRGRTCANCRILIIGGGPCGLRTAIDAQLLGAKVVVIEKRDRMTRNNVVHLWPFVIQDLRNLAAKKFFGKFCAGSIDHISIRQLQFILLKVALILGVELHEGVGFEGILEPRDTGTEKFGWRASVTPADHPVSNYEFDVLIAADGKRNTLQGFKRKEFRGKLAIAITANFINKHTKEEAAVPEISGTAFIFNQKFFLDLKKQFFIDLENLVYYKGETHYFVMTAKKQSLLQRNVLLKDYSETTSLLSRENIDYAALREYALDAAAYATNFELPKLDFAVNHYGQPDVAVFDFTSMFAAENASRAIEKLGYKMLICLVGDGLLEPFWPTGSGCARGFLSALDACWAVRSWSMGIHPLGILAERESIYRLLAQTTPQSVAPDFSHYTVDPATRYRNLNKGAVLPHQVLGFFDTDNPSSKQNINLLELPQVHTKKKKRDSQVHSGTLLAWLRKQVAIFNLEIDNLTAPFKNGLLMCAVLHRYRPDLIDFATLDVNNPSGNLKLAFGILEKEYSVPPIPNIEEMVEKVDTAESIIIIIYLSQIYHLFRGEIPFIRHSKTGSPEPDKKRSITPRTSTNREPIANNPDTNVRPVTQTIHRTSDSENVSSQKKSRKRRSSARYHGQSIAERMKKLRDKKHQEAQKKKEMARSSFLARLETKSLKMLESNALSSQSFCVDDDYNISSYRQNAPEFKSRVKDLEKLLYPEAERTAQPTQKGAQIGGFSSRIKTIEDQIIDGSSVNVTKKPRDLLRAIGKIETSDWNFKQIEDKIQENQLGRPPAHGREKVPKWNREQFLARQTKIVGHAVEQQESGDGKFHDIDSSLKHLDRQLKEGNILETGERGKNKVANLAGQFTKKKYTEEEQPILKVNNNSKQVKLNHGKLDICHACKKKVYLMEKINPEDNLTFHKSCFKCHYCCLTLKIGSYTYDRDGKFGFNFFCQHHFGMVGRVSKVVAGVLPKVQSKDQKDNAEVPRTLSIDKKSIKMLNRDETPERIELENHTLDVALSEEPCDEMDEDEWSDINFGNSFTVEHESSGNGDGEESSSNDDYSEALDDERDESDDDAGASDDSRVSDVGSDGEFSTESSDNFSYHEYSSGDEDGGSGTEESEQRVAREQRRQEVAIRPPPLTSSPTDTEVASDEESSSETSAAANSATEVSTDSEFAHDDPTPTRELPAIIFNDKFVCKTRGHFTKHANEIKKFQVPDCETITKKKVTKVVPPKLDNKINDFTKVHVKTKFIVNGNTEKKEKENTGIRLELKNLIPVEPKLPIAIPRDYLLSRTQSTSGIATKRALELKKKYLLSPQTTIGLQKSDSASQLDTKLKNFHSNISECQKLLNPAPDISPSMQAFLENSSKRNGGLLSPTNMNLLPMNTFDMGLKQKIPTFNFTINKSSNNNSDTIVCDTKLENPITENITEKAILSTLNSDKNNSNIEDKTIRTLNSNVENPLPTITDAKAEAEELVVENSATKFVQSHSPVLETSIVVPNIPWKATKNEELSITDMESDSLLSTDSSSEDRSSKDGGQDSIAIPRVEIRKPCGEVMQLDSLMIIDGKYIGSQGSEDENPEPVAKSWTFNNNQVIETVNTQISSEKLKPVIPEDVLKSDGHASPNSDSGNDITAIFTDNEALDWAVDDSSIDIECNPNASEQRNNRKQLGTDNSWDLLLHGDFNASEHVCGKGTSDSKKFDLSPSNLLAYDHSDIDFMDTGSEESLIENLTSSKNRELLVNRGFVEFVEISMDNSVVNTVKPQIIEAVNRHCDSPVNDRSMDFIEQGACVLNNDTYLKNILKVDNKPSNVSKDVDIEENSQFILKKSIDLECSDLNIVIPTVIETITTTPEDKNEEILDSAKILCDDISLNITNNETDSNTESKSPMNNNGDDASKSISESGDSSLHKRSCNSPKTSRRLEEISKEKVKQKDVIHQMVMDRMSKSSINSEKRMNRRSRSSINPETFGKKFEFSVSVADAAKGEPNLNSEKIKQTDIKHDHVRTSHVKLKPLNDESTENKDVSNMYLQNLNSSFPTPNGKSKIKYPNNSEAFSLPDLPQAVRQECGNTNKLLMNFNTNLTASNTKDVHERTTLSKENFDLPVCHATGIVPGFRQLSLDDCSGKLVQHVTSLRKTDTCSNNDMANVQSMSYNNLYLSEYNNPFSSDHLSKKNKNRDSERRKSIIKTVSDFFKRRDSTGHLAEKKNRLQKDKYKSKSCYNLDYSDKPEQCHLEGTMSSANPNSDEEASPPPIPPLPTNIGQFSGEAEKHMEAPILQSENTCLLASERHKRIKKIRCNIKALETKESEIMEQYEELLSSVKKRNLYSNRQAMIRLTNFKRQLRMFQFQHQVENFLVEDLLLEDKYYELRLKLTKPTQSKRESNTTKLINKDMMDIVSSRRFLGDKLREITSRYHSKEAEEEVIKHEFSSNSKDSLDI